MSESYDEFIAYGDKHRLELLMIAKEVTGRTMVLGFEYKKTSKHYAKKWMFSRPVWLEDIRKTPPTAEQVKAFNLKIAENRKEDPPDESLVDEIHARNARFAASTNPAVPPAGE